MIADALIVLAPWVFVVWRMTKLNLRSGPSRYGLITLLSIALVNTTENKTIALAIDHLANLPDLGRVLEYTCLTITCFSWGATCLRVLLEEERQNRLPHKPNRWVLYLAPISLAAILVLWFVEVKSGQPIQDYVIRTDHNLAMTLIAQTYLFCTLVGIGMVTASYQVENEKHLALRLRLVDLLAAHISLATLSGSILVIHSLMLLKFLPNSFDTPLLTLMLAISTLFMCSNFLPARAYTRLAIGVDYLKKLWQIRALQSLDAYIASLISAPPYPLTLRQAVQSPQYELLQLNMAILDREKLLLASQSPAAHNIAQMLSQVSLQADTTKDRETQFSELVRGLVIVAKRTVNIRRTGQL
jgi:hypothetical protein